MILWYHAGSKILHISSGEVGTRRLDASYTDFNIAHIAVTNAKRKAKSHRRRTKYPEMPDTMLWKEPITL